MENEVKAPELVEEVVDTPIEDSVENTPAVEPVAEPAPVVEEPAPVVEEPAEPAVDNSFAASDDDKKDDCKDSDEGKEETSEDDEDKKKDFVKAEEEDEKDEKKEEDKKSDENSDAQTDDEEDKKKEKDFALLQEQYSALKSDYDAMKIKYDELVAFKAKIEDAEKDAMIEKFCFLSDEDKKDVIENKAKYTVDEIESKLSVICVRNKVNFDLYDNTKNDIKTEESKEVLTYSLNEVAPSVPAWVRAVQNTQNKK